MDAQWLQKVLADHRIYCSISQYIYYSIIIDLVSFRKYTHTTIKIWCLVWKWNIEIDKKNTSLENKCACLDSSVAAEVG